MKKTGKCSSRQMVMLTSPTSDQSDWYVPPVMWCEGHFASHTLLLYSQLHSNYEKKFRPRLRDILQSSTGPILPVCHSYEQPCKIQKQVAYQGDRTTKCNESCWWNNW